MRVYNCYYRLGREVIKAPYCKIRYDGVGRVLPRFREDVKPVVRELEVEGVVSKKKVSGFNQYINSLWWVWFRELYRLSDKPKECEVCGSLKYQLHHLTYERRGNELLDDVVPLCWKHHKEIHRDSRIRVDWT
jgi:hypothetical protein